MCSAPQVGGANDGGRPHSGGDGFYADVVETSHPVGTGREDGASLAATPGVSGTLIRFEEGFVSCD